VSGNILWTRSRPGRRTRKRRVTVHAAAALALGLFAASGALAEPVRFTYVPVEAAPASVSLRGDMNSWGETPLERGEDGTWAVTVDLPPGEYPYKFFVDGQWPSDMSRGGVDGGPMDPEAHGYVDDGFGGKNAVRVVGGGGPGLKGRPDLSRQRAHWVERDLVVWDVTPADGERVVLVWSAAGELVLE